MAKGPTKPAYVNDVFSEVAILSSLQRHPSIIGPPVALITTPDEDDDRVIGYLLMYYPNGNVRDYSIENGSKLNAEIFCKWSTQMARALSHLLYRCNFTYVDIKPDNFLVDENQNLVLADFSNEGCTPWIIAPELFHGHSIKQTSTEPNNGEFTYESVEPRNTTSNPRLSTIPDHWPCEAREKVMVFSLARSVWMIWDAIPLENFTMAGLSLHKPGGPEGFDPSRTVFKHQPPSPGAANEVVAVPQKMKDFVLRCVDEDPKQRPTLAEVETFFLEFNHD